MRKERGSYGQPDLELFRLASTTPSRERLEYGWKDAIEVEIVDVAFVALVCASKRQAEDARQVTPVFGDLPTKHARYPHIFA